MIMKRQSISDRMLGFDLEGINGQDVDYQRKTAGKARRTNHHFDSNCRLLLVLYRGQTVH
jgi:hypothetical protein